MASTTVIWLTGLSGSGKSTIAHGFVQWAESNGKKVYVLDGDEIRAKSHRHLDFTENGIKENNKLVTKLCIDLLGAYDFLIVSVITPYESSRAYSRKALGQAYVEVYVKASLDTVVKRDTKGFYRKALNGEMENFIGISPATPYEIPALPDLTLDTDSCDEKQCIERLIDFITQKTLLNWQVHKKKI